LKKYRVNKEFDGIYIIIIVRVQKGVVIMFTYMLVALLFTFSIGFLIETIRVKIAFDRIQRINIRIEKKMMNMLKKTNDLNIFFINDLRRMIKDEFVRPHLIDEFELYKIDDNRLHVKFVKERAEQEIEIYLVKEHFDLKEVSLRYDDRIDFNS